MSDDQGAMDLARTVWELEQRRLITETLIAYCTHVDRNDPATLVATVFSEDARFRLGSRHQVVGRDSLAKMFAKTLAAFRATSHHLSNVVVTFDNGDDAARASSYVYAWHETTEGRRVEVWGGYRDELRRTAEGWRIEERQLAMSGYDGWEAAPFERFERLPNPTDPPSPAIERL